MDELQTVLLVDDEADIREVARMALEMVGGLTVHAAAGGPEALELAESIQPDLILLDVMMPQMDGPTVLLRLKENEATRAIPVFFLTAKAQAPAMREYEALGAAGVLIKPFDPMTLTADIKNRWNTLAD